MRNQHPHEACFWVVQPFGTAGSAAQKQHFRIGVGFAPRSPRSSRSLKDSCPPERASWGNSPQVALNFWKSADFQLWTPGQCLPMVCRVPASAPVSSRPLLSHPPAEEDQSRRSQRNLPEQEESSSSGAHSHSLPHHTWGP